MENIYNIQAFYIASMVGAVAVALSGFLAGVRKKLDVMGVFILAFLTANGGGIIRDLLVGRKPSLLISTEPFWLVVVVTALALLFKLHKREDVERKWIFIACDAIGLAAFGITGALIGIQENIHLFGVITLALLTATGGGLIRDLLINELPEVFHVGFFGSVAIFIAIILYGLNKAEMMNQLTILITFILALALRFVAYKNKWNLPKL